MKQLSFRRAFALLVLATVLLVPVGCGSEEGVRNRDSPKRDEPKRDAADKPPPAPEPAKTPQLEEKPAGKVVEIGNAPEGLAADPETGLVAVALRKPNKLALVDGESGEIVREVELPGSARHLDLAAPGGPVLVPVESSDSLVQVGLPDGEILEETPVGDFPHAAAASNGRIVVANEKGDSASIIEAGQEIEKIETPLQPGGVAATDDGLVGVVGVRGLTMEVFDTETLKSLGGVDAGEGPTHVKAGPDNRLYVADTRGDAILVYDTSPEPKRIQRLTLPGSPYGIAVDSERNHLWVTLTAKQQVVQFALEGGSLCEISRYTTVRQPNTVAVDPNTGRVFVASRSEDQLQILEPQ
jgi:DNA-binding beta-propeller fold protein YncE